MAETCILHSQTPGDHVLKETLAWKQEIRFGWDYFFRAPKKPWDIPKKYVGNFSCMALWKPLMIEKTMQATAVCGHSRAICDVFGATNCVDAADSAINDSARACKTAALMTSRGLMVQLLRIHHQEAWQFSLMWYPTGLVVWPKMTQDALIVNLGFHLFYEGETRPTVNESKWKEKVPGMTGPELLEP